ENVLEGADFEAEFLGDTKKHENFVFAIAVGVDVALAFENFDKRIEAKVAARRRQILFAGSDFLIVGVPRVFVVARFGEGAANGFFHTHAGSGIAALTAGDREIRALGVFAESEFDSGYSAFERKLLRRLAPAQFDHDRLAAYGVGAAVENVCRGDAAGEIAKD